MAQGLHVNHVLLVAFEGDIPRARAQLPTLRRCAFGSADDSARHLYHWRWKDFRRQGYDEMGF